MLKPLNIYACPGCRGKLQQQQDAFRCSSCDRSYRLTGGIPDFLLVRPEESENPVLRDVDEFGKLAAVYETRLWFPLVLRLLGGWHASTPGELVAFARGMMSTVGGRVLDVATGTATYGRHVAGTERTRHVLIDCCRRLDILAQVVHRSGDLLGAQFDRFADGRRD